MPTYVIGFSTGVADAEAQARLQKIASDTGGQFFPLNDASQLQSVMNTIGAAITCQTPPQTFTDPLKQGAGKTHASRSARHQIASDRAHLVAARRTNSRSPI